MTWEQLQKYLIGKVFLIGLTILNEDGALIDQYQTHGVVKDLTDNGIFKIIRKDDSIFQIPYDKDTIQKADRGEYRERETGFIIKDPDYIVTWEIIAVANDDLEEIKKGGYIPSDKKER